MSADSCVSSSARYDQHQESGNGRPRHFQQPLAMPHAYNQLVRTTAKYGPSTPYYLSPALHMSSSKCQSRATSDDSMSSTPSETTKRSREDLNEKEKQRMFKLNDRINQLKTLLNDAGVQTKKSKQSVLDNTSHYIEMLRGDLAIAQQKAERAEKLTETFRAHSHNEGRAGVAKVTNSVFQKTTTPRVVLDMDMKTLVFNAAFVKYTGLSELVLKMKKTLQPYLCADEIKFRCIIQKVRETKKSVNAVVKTSIAVVNLVAALVTDNRDNATNVEFSLIPMEIEQEQQQQQQQPSGTKRQKTIAALTELVAKSGILKDASSKAAHSARSDHKCEHDTALTRAT